MQMQTAQVILLVLSVLILITRLGAFLVCKFKGGSIETFQLGSLFQKQPWLPALLILIDFAVAYALVRFNIFIARPGWSSFVSAALGVFQAGLSVWLLLAEANAIYNWLSQLVAADSVTHILLPHIKSGIQFIFLVLSLPFVVASFPVYPATEYFSDKFTKVLTIWAVAWLLIQITFALEKVIVQRLYGSLASNFQARRLYTQARVFKRIITFLIGLISLAATAMVFDNIRELGTSILASAGLVTVILGFAAQKTLGNLLVGVQIAITQPIRMNDIITIENELGTIEEITLSYVVLRIWDLRRLIIPINYFLEKPFQNLTRVSTELLSPFFFYADYNLPVTVIREKFLELVKESPFWDGKVAKLEVVEAQPNVMKLRALASARDSSGSWNLKCELLEKLLAFIIQEYPHSLPKVRNINFAVT